MSPLKLATLIVALLVSRVVAQGDPLASQDVPPARQANLFADVIRRVHEYVVVYEDHELSSVVASELYSQEREATLTQPRLARVMRSDYFIFQLPPSEDWFALRQVKDVDGAPVPDQAARFAELFAGLSGGRGDTATERAMSIAADNARFNIGEVYRTINVPTFALRFLRPMSRNRFTYQKVGEESVDGTPTWVIGYDEIKGPTFSATQDGRDIPAHGRFWIEPDSGAVVRSEMILGGTRRLRDRATITVTYRLDPSLGFRVPVEMRERYDTPNRKNGEVIVATASYTDYRPFTPRPAP